MADLKLHGLQHPERSLFTTHYLQYIPRCQGNNSNNNELQLLAYKNDVGDRLATSRVDIVT